MHAGGAQGGIHVVVAIGRPEFNDDMAGWQFKKMGGTCMLACEQGVSGKSSLPNYADSLIWGYENTSCCKVENYQGPRLWS